MIYLLDVSALISLASNEHEFHPRVVAWLHTLDADEDVLASCAITELGLVRILPQTSGADLTVKEAQETLVRVKATSIVPFTFLADTLGIDKLPAWVKNPKQTTDGHLVALAKSHGAALATLDGKIPGAFVIPNH